MFFILLYVILFTAKELYDQVSVVVQHPRLNHKKYKVRVHVKSEVAKTVLVKFFLAPKYDSHGNEIPLHVNTHNFMQIDEFVHDCKFILFIVNPRY